MGTVTIELKRYEDLVEAETRLKEEYEKKVEGLKKTIQLRDARIDYLQCSLERLPDEINKVNKATYEQRFNSIEKRYKAEQKDFIQKHKKEMAVLNDYRKVFKKHYPNNTP